MVENLGAGFRVMLNPDASLNHPSFIQKLAVCSIVWYPFFSKMEKCERYSTDSSIQKHFFPPFIDCYRHVPSTGIGPGEVVVSGAHIGHV